MGEFDDLKAKAIRRLELEFESAVDTTSLQAVEGVRDVSADGPVLTVSFEGPIDAILREATALGVVNLHSRDADLEDIFLTYYRDDSPSHAEATSDPTGEAEHADVAT